MHEVRHPPEQGGRHGPLRGHGVDRPPRRAVVAVFVSLADPHQGPLGTSAQRTFDRRVGHLDGGELQRGPALGGFARLDRVRGMAERAFDQDDVIPQRDARVGFAVMTAFNAIAFPAHSFAPLILKHRPSHGRDEMRRRVRADGDRYLGVPRREQETDA